MWYNLLTATQKEDCDMKERYWLRISGHAWQEATKDQFVQAERSAGFRPKPGCGDVATGGFSNGSLQGRVTYGDITDEKYPREPDFVELANKSSITFPA